MPLFRRWFAGPPPGGLYVVSGKEISAIGEGASAHRDQCVCPDCGEQLDGSQHPVCSCGSEFSWTTQTAGSGADPEGDADERRAIAAEKDLHAVHVARVAADAGLSEIYGSVKEVSWANRLRWEELDRFVRTQLPEIEEDPDCPLLKGMLQEYLRLFNRFDARQWIHDFTANHTVEDRIWAWIDANKGLDDENRPAGTAVPVATAEFQQVWLFG